MFLFDFFGFVFPLQLCVCMGPTESKSSLSWISWRYHKSSPRNHQSKFSGEPLDPEMPKVRLILTEEFKYLLKGVVNLGVCVCVWGNVVVVLFVGLFTFKLDLLVKAWLKTENLWVFSSSLFFCLNVSQPNTQQ